MAQGAVSATMTVDKRKRQMKERIAKMKVEKLTTSRAA
jgi:hypothetical protein